MRLTRFRAFHERGVRLKFPTRSWSGVRADDGTVILAVRARDLRRDERGSRCKLSPPHAAAHDEFMRHCRLAELRGRAEGLLTYGDEAMVDADVLLPLSVVRRGADYWAEVLPSGA